MFFKPAVGLVDVPPDVRAPHYLEAERRVTLAKRRTACSLLAFASDDPDVQKLLPHIVIINQRMLTIPVYERLQEWLSTQPTSVLLKRYSAWVNQEVMCEVLHILAQALKPVEPVAHIILMLDGCPVHTAGRVIRYAALMRVHVHFVAASMTGLLQPLDAYIFAGLKHELRTRLEMIALASPDGEVSYAQSLRATFECATKWLTQRHWMHAFRKCGFGNMQMDVGQHVKRRLQWPDGVAPIGCELPDLVALQRVWPSKKTIPLGWLFHLVTHPPPARPNVLAVAPFEATPTVAVDVWSGRLRSASAQRLDQPVCVTESLPAVPVAPWSLTVSRSSTDPCPTQPVTEPRSRSPVVSAISVLWGAAAAAAPPRPLKTVRPQL